MIYGQFTSTQGIKYKVEIVAPIDIEIGGDEKKIYFSEDPITIEQDIDDTFQHIIKTSATISLLVNEYIGDNIFTAYDREISVKIYKNDKCIFDGFLQPQSYNQDFASEYTELQLKCDDYLCTLEKHNYKERTDYDALRTSCGNVSFFDIITEVLGTDRKIYYDNSISYNQDEKTEYLFKNAMISEIIMVGDEEDDLWTAEDCLNEILQYFNLHIVQLGDEYYIFNWATLRENQDNITFTCVLGGTEEISVPSNIIEVDKSYYASDDTQISMADIYNKISVECDLQSTSEIFNSPLDDDSLVSPYSNFNQYAKIYEWKKNENNRFDKDQDKIKHWYFQYKQNSNWTLRYLMGGNVYNLNDTVEYDGNNTAINQYLLPLGVMYNKLSPIMCSFGSVDYEDYGTKNPDMKDYLIISINGSENKDTNRLEEWNNIMDALYNAGGMIEYNSRQSAGMLSPTDERTTNYLIFSGKISMQPPLSSKWIDDFIMPDDYMNPPDTYQIYYWGKYPLQVDGEFTPGNLIPYLGNTQYQDKYHEHYGTWFQFGYNDIAKLPLLLCEMKIGDKYCVETAANEFHWYTEEECTKLGINHTFSLGIKPTHGDMLLCKEWDLSNTVATNDNISASGTAIPINASDGLNGKMEFRIIGPVYSQYDQAIRRHATWFRSEEWWSTSLPVMEFIQNMYIQDFKCEVYTNNGLSNAKSDKDLIYVTDVFNNSQEEKDDITFKFNTALTTEESLAKGVTTLANLSNVVYKPTNVAYKNITNTITNETCKAEEMYIKDYYAEYNTPKLIVETTLDTTKTSPWKKYQFSYFPNKTFYAMGTELNLKYDTTKYKLKQI